MNSFGHPDIFHFRAAIGWHELGNQVEAEAELEQLSPAALVHPDVLEFRWLICAKNENWEAALALATTLVEIAGDRVGVWIHKAYAQRRVSGGSIELAEAVLRQAIVKFPEDPMIHYNLACYACQLGRLDEARELINHAFALGDAKEMKAMALHDPDLQPIFKGL